MKYSSCDYSSLQVGPSPVLLVCIRYLRKNSGPLFNEASVLACTGATEPARWNGRRSQRARAGRALGLAKYARADALAELVTKAR